MFSEERSLFYFFCVLNGFLAFLQLTEGNAGSTSGTTSKTYFFYHRPAYPRDCKEVFDQCSGKNSSGVFVIKPDGYPYPFEVYCNNSFDSGGWTVLMRRFDGSLLFTRTWADYKKGFGFIGSEFWLGNDKLAYLTNQQKYELRVDVMTSNGTRAFITYSYFRISDEWSNYALSTLGERTCQTPTSCQNNCQESSRCVCPDGFYLKGSDCVTADNCECYSTIVGKVIPVGQSYINNQCSRRCSCSRSGLSCNSYGCDQNARCTSTSDGGRCDCNTGYLPDGSRCRRPKDCDEVESVEGYTGSGLYYIFPSSSQEFRVYCNMSGGRWTVLQRRIPGSSRSFFQSWSSYKRGFGELDEDFWLGNDKIHYLTSQKNYQLRIDITDSSNRHYRAQYNGFRIGNEGSKYRITVLGTYSGNAGYDAMRDHLNQPFTTHDQDNDDWDGSDCRYYYYYYYCYYFYYSLGNCARLHEGAWWYKYRNRVSSPGGCDRSTSLYSTYYSYRYTCCENSNCNNCGSYAHSCTFSNLNGRASGEKGKTIIWHGLTGNDCGIKFTEMKIRPL
ncbi:Fibrinogen-like protein A [Holothuria leucospilota]|uniref:Fibrinogen-like protein A n=1 Tax=Holothuria leucospilota TaxID=206669 RepID=A0A9Q1H694_HOLLE|nr:Fibrinogen-like protein A [Holothuria leucospilota]